MMKSVVKITGGAEAKHATMMKCKQAASLSICYAVTLKTASSSNWKGIENSKKSHRVDDAQQQKNQQISKMFMFNANTAMRNTRMMCYHCTEGMKYLWKIAIFLFRRQSYIGGIYGCPDLDAFYENGICRELKEAMEQRMELTQAEIDEAKQKAEETNKEAERRAARLKAEAKTDKEKEEANEFAKSTENNKQMAAVYIRIKNQYIDNPNIDKATENWPYTGFAKDLRMREKLHNRTLAAAEQHFFVTRDEASYDKNQETAVKVIDDIPLLLARGFEQAGIISRG